MPSDASTAMGMSRLGFTASSPIEVTDSNPTRIRIAMQAWMMTKLIEWGEVTDPAVRWNWKERTFSLMFGSGLSAEVIAWSGAYVRAMGLSLPSAPFMTEYVSSPVLGSLIFLG